MYRSLYVIGLIVLTPLGAMDQQGSLATIAQHNDVDQIECVPNNLFSATTFTDDMHVQFDSLVQRITSGGQDALTPEARWQLIDKAMTHAKQNSDDGKKLIKKLYKALSQDDRNLFIPMACERCPYDVIAYLQREVKDINLPKEAVERLIKDAAAKKNGSYFANTLLFVSEEDKNINIDGANNTAGHYAVIENCIPCIQLLLAAEHTNLSKTNNNEHSILQIAVEKEFNDITNLMVQNNHHISELDRIKKHQEDYYTHRPLLLHEVTFNIVEQPIGWWNSIKNKLWPWSTPEPTIEEKRNAKKQDLLSREMSVYEDVFTDEHTMINVVDHTVNGVIKRLSIAYSIDQKYRNYLQKIKECPMCLDGYVEHGVSPVLCCSNEHYACHACYDMVNKCPVCSEQFGKKIE